MRATPLCVCLLLALAGCAAPENDYDYATRGLSTPDDGAERTPEPPTTARGREAAAYLNGRALAWDELRDRLAERSGGAVLREVVLERLLEEACARDGLIVTQEDLARERELVLSTLEDDGIARDGATREEILGALLRRRGLGEEGFRALLLRTAMSRALVRDDVVLSENVIARAEDLRFGTRYAARLIVASTPAQAARARQRLLEGEPFADVAAELSTDSSAASGGRIPPIHPADLSWPGALREAVLRTPPGEPSELIAIENGYALLVVEEAITPPDAGLTPGERRGVALRDARLEAERLLMANLAIELLESADLDIVAPSLARSYGQRPTR